ncbi:Chorion peroxidase [Frankliniella fusca]|uniref:Chorion peroxidase n=1 Tax=Frankliniella fusca TaxID=407009 RepID=A0AAE1GVP9_9NEOP|nr:Chorion peroxidase [Frankliniella fusca]
MVNGRTQKNANLLEKQTEGVQLGCPDTKRPCCRGSKSSGLLPTYRSLDGSCHKTDPTLGMAGTPFMRLLHPKYGDGNQSLRTSLIYGKQLPSPRVLVNTLFGDVQLPNQDVNHFFMNWGQLIAHDLTLTNTSIPKGQSSLRTSVSRTMIHNVCSYV